MQQRLNKTPPISKPRGMKNLYAAGEKNTIDLSLSENPLGCSPLVLKKMQDSTFVFNHYPATNGSKLKNALADKLSCQPENIFVSNGSEAIINMLPRIFANVGDTVLVPKLTFPMFGICSELAGATVNLAPMSEQLEIDLQAMAKMITKKIKIIFICNPNNPTGDVIEKQELVSFIEKVPESVLVVIDEANIEFAGDSCVDQAISKPNVIILRTFSKGFGLANLRIGFAVANRTIIEKFEETTTLFPICGLSEELSLVALADDDFLVKTRKCINSQRVFLEDGLRNLGFKIFPSKANNIFAKIPDKMTTEAFWNGMQKADISLVNGTSFPGFNDRFFRVSPRLLEANRAFLAAVEQISNNREGL